MRIQPVWWISWGLAARRVSKGVRPRQRSQILRPHSERAVAVLTQMQTPVTSAPRRRARAIQPRQPIPAPNSRQTVRIRVLLAKWEISERKLKFSTSKVQIPTSNVEVPRSNVKVPGPNVKVPGPNIKVPGPNIKVPSSNIEIPGSNIEIPGPNVEIPSSNVQVP